MMIANALGFLATFFFVFYLPGRMLVERWLDSPEPEEYFPISIAVGIALVGTLVTLVVGLIQFFWSGAIATPLVLWGAGLSVSAALGLTGTKPLLRPRSLFTRPTRTQAGLWAMGLASLLFFSVHYDDDLLREDGPLLILASSMDVGVLGVHTHPSSEGTDTGPDRADADDSLLNRFSMLSGWDGEALGPGIIPGCFLPLFGGFGLRLTYALAGLLLPGLGFLLGRALFHRAWAGWATGLLLTFSPWALEVRTFDKNFMANIFGTLTLVLLFRARPAALLAGLATAFFLGIHHVELLALPFVVWYLWHSQRQGTCAQGDGWRFLASLLAWLSPYLIMHVMFVLMHDGTLFENTFDRPLAPHSFFGIEFMSPMLLNFPFIPELLRSPYHAYPPLLAYPLDIASRFGLLLVALIPAGVLFLVRQQAARALVLAAWFVPLMLFLMVQSNWVDANKMGLPAMATAPLVLAIVGGVVFLTDRQRSAKLRAVVAMFGLALPLALVPALQAHEAPVDERVYAYLDDDDGMEVWTSLTHHLDETPAYVALDRAALQMSLMPRARADHEWRPATLARSLRQFADNLRHPSLRERRNSMPDFLRLSFFGFGVGIAPLRALHSGDPQPSIESWQTMSPADESAGGPSTVAWIDMNQSPILAPAPLSLGPAPAGTRPLLEGQPPLALVQTFEAAWAPEYGASLLAGRDRLGQAYVVIAPGHANPKGRPEWLSLDERPAHQFPDGRVPIRVPSDGVVRIIELRSYFPAVWYSRFALFEDLDGDGQAERIIFTRAVLLSPA